MIVGFCRSDWLLRAARLVRPGDARAVNLRNAAARRVLWPNPAAPGATSFASDNSKGCSRASPAKIGSRGGDPSASQARQRSRVATP
jgi:hypothetical protein